jgi:hypothetical protein
MPKLRVSIGALLVASLALACSSISDSSRSISKSVSSPSRSISDSSKSSSGGGSKEDATYVRDVRNFSYGFAKSGGDPAAFARGVGSIAQRRGIQNWESDQSTCHAVGQGFHDAGIGQSAAEELIGRSVAPGSACAGWMRAGYSEP